MMKKNMKRNRKNEENKKILKAEYNAIRAKQRKEMIKSIAKYAVSAIILISWCCYLLFYFQKKVN